MSANVVKTISVIEFEYSDRWADMWLKDQGFRSSAFSAHSQPNFKQSVHVCSGGIVEEGRPFPVYYSTHLAAREAFQEAVRKHITAPAVVRAWPMVYELEIRRDEGVGAHIFDRHFCMHARFYELSYD